MPGRPVELARGQVPWGMGVALVSPAELLRRRRATDELIIVDARSIDEYRRGHIPGAISLDWTTWCEPAPSCTGDILRSPGFWGTLADRSPAWFAERLEASGLSSRLPVVVYAGGPRSKGRDGRIAWMLLYLGAGYVSLLDGGWQGWCRVGGPIERTSSRSKRGHFRVEMQPQRRCHRAELADRTGTTLDRVLVDTRTPDEFDGNRYQYQPRMGHLPDAVLVPFDSLFHPSGRYLGLLSYLDRVPSVVIQATHLVAYCEVGVRACSFALLHEIHTGQVVRVYDGSMMEWSLDPSLPVHAPTALG